MNPPHDAQGYGTPFTGTARFEVIDQLGAGAMCVVYRARDRKHGEVVALKTLRHLDSNSLYRLKQEFRALSQFDHPNLVSFSELVHSEQGWFVTMELVEGIDFLTYARGHESERESRSSSSTWGTNTGLIVGEDVPEEPEPEEPRGLPDLIKLRSGLRQLAEGVQTLHSAGRVHRDLKPSNVLVTGAGRVVILDFGLVAEIDQDYTEGTLHQNIAGSAAYMSPEQSVGRPLSESSDWYSVGVMLYESLTGVWPYQGHLYQILTQKQESDPTPPIELVPDCPQDLNDLAMGLLAREPEDRPSGAEVLAVLQSRHPQAVEHIVLQPRFRYRERYLEVMQKAFQTAMWGRAVTLLVRGPAGIGKTKLIREFVKDTKRRGQVIVLKGQCFEWESLPYKAIDGLMDNLSRVLRRLDHRDVMRLANGGLPYLAALFPVLNRVDAFGLTEPADLHRIDEATLRQRGFEGLFGLLRDLAAHVPVVIFLDDAQWGDERSAAVLGEILKFSVESKILVLLAYQPGERGPFIQRFLPPVQQAGVPVQPLDLEPLSFEQAAVVASEMLDRDVGDDDVRRIALESGGVPLYVKELVSQLVFQSGREATADAELNEITVSEISALPDSAQRLLSLLALCEQPLPDDVALMASGLSMDAFQAISTLRAHHLISVQGMQGQDTLQIGSEAVREYVIDRIPEDWRVAFHGRVASEMEARRTYPAEAIVKHYAGARMYEKAGLQAWLAASELLRADHTQEAVWLLEKAKDYGEWSAAERQRILAHLGRAYAELGAGPKAAEAFHAAASDAPPERARELNLRAASELIGSGHLEQGRPMLDQLLAEAGIKLGGGRSWFGAFRRRPKWKQIDFSQPSERETTDEELFRLDLAWTAAMGRRLMHAGEGAAAHRSQLEMALEVADPERSLRAIAAEVRIQGSEANPEWRASFQHLVGQAKAARSRAAIARVSAAGAVGALTEGAWVEAAELAESAEHTFRHNQVGAAWERFECRAIAAFAQLRRGDFRAAADKALPLVRELEQAENHYFLTLLHAGVISWLRMAEGDPDAGLAQLAQTPQELASTIGRPFLHVLVTWTHLELYKGRPRVAWDYLNERWSAAETGIEAAPKRLAIEVWLTRARVCVALAASGADPEDWLHAARAALAQAAKLDLTWSYPWIQLVEGAASKVQGGPGITSALAAVFERGDQSMGSAVALVFTDQHDQAVQWMQDQGVRDPERFARVFAPGL